MLDLRIFILFVLAGLCFGASLEDQSSDGNSHGSNPPAEPQPSAQAEQSDKVNGQSKEQEQKEEQTEEKVEDKEKESSTKNQEEKRLGHALPDFIGDSKQKKEYVITLQKSCDAQNQVYKINEEQINFKSCTYSCMKLGNFPESVERRIPVGMTCGEKNMKCPEQGDCPTPPLPSC
uniref:Putative ixodes 8-cys protein n=1 Tax=Ixodes ricinus TaxID=34613 RepID=A0A0K8R979_IXORI